MTDLLQFPQVNLGTVRKSYLELSWANKTRSDPSCLDISRSSSSIVPQLIACIQFFCLLSILLFVCFLDYFKSAVSFSKSHSRLFFYAIARTSSSPSFHLLQTPALRATYPTRINPNSSNNSKNGSSHSASSHQCVPAAIDRWWCSGCSRYIRVSATTNQAQLHTSLRY